MSVRFGEVRAVAGTVLFSVVREYSLRSHGKWSIRVFNKSWKGKVPYPCDRKLKLQDTLTKVYFRAAVSTARLLAFLTEPFWSEGQICENTYKIKDPSLRDYKLHGLQGSQEFQHVRGRVRQRQTTKTWGSPDTGS